MLLIWKHLKLIETNLNGTKQISSQLKQLIWETFQESSKLLGRYMNVSLNVSYVMNVSKTSFVRYGCLSKRLLYVMDVSPKFFCTLWISQICPLDIVDHWSFTCNECLRHVLYIINVSMMSFVRYGCLSKILLYVMDFSNMFFGYCWSLVFYV